MRVSIIIPTYNEKEVLEDCIESLGAQSYDDFEIIIVDDGSTDGSKKILENLEKTLPNFKFFSESHRGAGAARNLGAKHAKGEILVFVDADMTFEKNFLRELVKPIEDNKVRGTFSKEEYVANWKNVWAKCWSINENWEERRRHPKNYPDHQPVFRAILKSEFDKVGGFTPGGYNDDWSLSKKLGYEAQNAPGAIFYHKNPDNLLEIFDHARWVAKREYKLGILGEVLALIRSSAPISLAIGVYKSFTFHLLPFTIFKMVYDLGIFTGIIEMLLTSKKSK